MRVSPSDLFSPPTIFVAPPLLSIPKDASFSEPWPTECSSSKNKSTFWWQCMAYVRVHCVNTTIRFRTTRTMKGVKTHFNKKNYKRHLLQLCQKVWGTPTAWNLIIQSRWQTRRPLSYTGRLPTLWFFQDTKKTLRTEDRYQEIFQLADPVSTTKVYKNSVKINLHLFNWTKIRQVQLQGSQGQGRHFLRLWHCPCTLPVNKINVVN